jgi:hypothetical protein
MISGCVRKRKANLSLMLHATVAADFRARRKLVGGEGAVRSRCLLQRTGAAAVT